MKATIRRSMGRLVCVVAPVLLAVAGVRAFAHCDTMNGPIIPEALAALEKGDVTPVLKWVRPDLEADIKNAFGKAVAVRAAGAEARELADHYFLETLIRVHRAGEGAPYTGLKEAEAGPIVKMADEALAEGSAEAMIRAIGNHMGSAIREKYDRALEARKHMDESVEAGRAYVEAYVTYMHFVEGVHDAILATGGHEHGEVEPAGASMEPRHQH